MMSMWERESPVTGEDQVGSESPCPGETLVGTSVSMSKCEPGENESNRSGRVTVSEQCNHILMLLMCVPDTRSW